MKLKTKYSTLRLILGDQLNAQHSWFKQRDDDVLYLIAELNQEATYVKHHIQKICAFFCAMGNFANALEKAKHQILYLTLDETKEFDSLPDLIKSLCDQFSINEFHYQRPDEYRLQQQLRNLKLTKTCQNLEVDSEHFLLPFDEISRFVKPKKHNRMETFYRKLRKRFEILMDGDDPIGGQWNFDGNNREKIKKADLQNIPEPLLFSNDVTDVLDRITRHKIPHFGESTGQLLWPVSRAQSLELLEHFCAQCLPSFGRYQDAMTCKHPHQWTLYHSRLSFALNSKQLHPMQVITAAITAYENSNDGITLPQIEGFVRQILGWREYVRCVYWVNMPDYADLNALNTSRTLPNYFWTGETKMACMKNSIQQSLDFAYAHHIQRLMITGNFCLLAGIEPNEVDNWYLGIYIDAIEWVEMPNTRGMSQFADGGWVATKPYCASGNYINKMSDYCKDCSYSVKEKHTEDACPFNSLYWNFMITHRQRLAKNPRIGMIYGSWDKQEDATKEATLERANWCLNNLNEL